MLFSMLSHLSNDVYWIHVDVRWIRRIEISYQKQKIPYHGDISRKKGKRSRTGRLQEELRNERKRSGSREKTMRRRMRGEKGKHDIVWISVT